MFLSNLNFVTISSNYKPNVVDWIPKHQVVKIDERDVGDAEVGPVTRRLQNAYKKLTEESGVPIPTYHP